MILVVDNYDSFTFNLVHYLMELGAKVEVVRNDALSAGQALSTGAQGFLISPGPCTPGSMPTESPERPAMRSASMRKAAPISSSARRR